MKHLTILLLTLSLLAACNTSPPQATSNAPTTPAAAIAEVKAAKVDEAKKAKLTHRYSPFVLNVPQGSVFKKISFKDVGFKLQDEDGEALLVYEVIAEALADELKQAQKLRLEAQVSYDEGNLDPNNHVFCGSDQLYVDLWRSSSPARWGYSLWSGCGDNDNFAWRELKTEVIDDPVEDVRPLTRDIVQTLATATERGCYQKVC
jgi:hypothetical protein